MKYDTIFRGVEDLHPRFFPIASAIEDEIIAAHQSGLLKLEYKFFETFRTPGRQAALFSGPNTKAGPWESDHQFGMAFDLAAWTVGGWSWAIPSEDFVRLGIIRFKFKTDLAPIIGWDPLHFASPLGKKIRDMLD